MSGGFFSVISISSQCVNPETLIIVDASGLQTTATFHNLLGTTPPTPPTPPPPLAIAPASQTGPCTGMATYTFAVTGGTPSYNVAASLGATVVQPKDSGIFSVTPLAAPSGTVVSIVAVDSGTPQLAASASVSCS
jgi:hypothetical protein